MEAAIANHVLGTEHVPEWWRRIDGDPTWQRWSFVALAGGYGLIALVAIVQLVRIQQRVPEYGWTTQKVRALQPVVSISSRSTLGAVFSRGQHTGNRDVQWQQHRSPALSC